MRFSRSPDGAHNPAKRRQNHIHDRPHHENLEGAEPVAEPVEDQAQRAIAEAENQPAHQT